jgi:dTDP-4-amino-4,6-dideoxygalactose transaminase
LRIKLKQLDAWNERRQSVAQLYLQALEGVTDIVRPVVPDFADPVWHLFVIRHPQRDKLQQDLASAGVGTLIHYPVPPHLQEAYADLGYQAGAFPIAESMAKEVLSLPMGPHVSEEQVNYVVDKISQSLST